MLQAADEYRSWALLGFLACPAAAAGVGARAALSGLLSETLLVHVYEDRVEPVHPLFERHVRPSLEKLADVIKDNGAAKAALDADRAAAKSLVEDAWRAAAAGAARERRLRRLLVARQLRDMGDELEDDPALIPQRLPALLAALAYAKAEALWYFRHAGEQLAGGPARGPLGHAPAAGVPEDGRVVQLVAAMARLQLLLVSVAPGCWCWQREGGAGFAAAELAILQASRAAVSPQNHRPIGGRLCAQRLFFDLPDLSEK
jgi:NCK-associated protein 1